MKRRAIIGMAAVVAGGLVAGAGAFAFGTHGGRHGIMKRVITAHIDELLDEAKATPAQRQAIYGARDRVFAAVEEHWKTRRHRLDEALALFEADRVSPEQVEALRRQGETEHRKIADAVSQAILEVHDALTPAQRKMVADHVRAHRRHHED